MSPVRLRANLMLLLAATIWGFSFVAQVLGAQHTGPATFNGVRFALGALSLAPLIVVLDRRGLVDAPARRNAWRRVRLPGALLGTVLFAASFLQQQGMGLTTAGKGSFITGLYMVLVPVAGMAFGHRTTVATWLGVVLAVIGLGLLCLTDHLTIAPGDALVLACAFFFAGHILLVDRFAGLDALRLSVTQFATCSALSLASAAFVEATPYAGILAGLGPILYGGLMTVGVAYTLQILGQRDAVPAHAALLMSLESVFGAVGGALFLGEAMSARGYVGCALMLAGILLAQVRAPGVEVAPAGEPTALPARDRPA